MTSLHKFLLALAVAMVFTVPALGQDISSEAQRYMIRGQVAMEDATSTSDFKKAVTEFRKATELAPDWGDAWFNLGVAQEKAGDIPGAIRSYRKYLDLSPEAADYSDVETQIIRLEYRYEQAEQERIKRRQADAEKARLDQLFKPFKGPWLLWECMAKGHVTCNEKEAKGSNWQHMVKAVPFEFPGDGTVVTTALCGKIVGIPQSGNISDTKWFSRSVLTSSKLWWTLSEDGPLRQIWSVTRKDYIKVSCTRPLDESRYNPKTRYTYDLYKRP